MSRILRTKVVIWAGYLIVAIKDCHADLGARRSTSAADVQTHGYAKSRRAILNGIMFRKEIIRFVKWCHTICVGLSMTLDAWVDEHDRGLLYDKRCSMVRFSQKMNPRSGRKTSAWK